MSTKTKSSALTKAELGRLHAHALGMFHNIILPEITPHGAILVRDEAGDVHRDPVTTHHLVEFCLELDPHFTRPVINSACAWFASGERSIRDPFLVTTLARADVLSAADKASFVEQILANRRPSGFIDMYAGFLDGGSIFSTLWAARILQLLGTSKTTSAATKKALAAVESHWDDVHRSSFKGFFCELCWTADPSSVTSPRVRKAVAELCAAQADDGTWDNSLLYTAYVLGNLIGMPGERLRAVNTAINRALRKLFALATDAKGLPAPIAEANNELVESAYLQLCIRSSLCAVRFLRQKQGDRIARDVAASVLAMYPNTYHTARSLAVELKKMNSQYGDIHKRFAHLDQYAAEILRESPFENNVFIMMPFRQDRDDRYAEIERIIRAELRKHGFRAWLASDKTVASQLWDNVASFLLACKYGVAVFTRGS